MGRRPVLPRLIAAYDAMVEIYEDHWNQAVAATDAGVSAAHWLMAAGQAELLKGFVESQPGIRTYFTLDPEEWPYAMRDALQRASDNIQQLRGYVDGS